MVIRVPALPRGETAAGVCDEALGQNMALPSAKVSKMFVNFHCFEKKMLHVRENIITFADINELKPWKKNK